MVLLSLGVKGIFFLGCCGMVSFRTFSLVILGVVGSCFMSLVLVLMVMNRFRLW